MLWAPNFKAERPQIFYQIFQITLASDHVGKFGGNRPRNRREDAPKRGEKKEYTRWRRKKKKEERKERNDNSKT